MSQGIENPAERAAFEDWYVQNAFDFERNSLGSRECGLQWKAWQARGAQQVQADAGADAREILPGWEFGARNSGEWVILPPTGDYWAASASTPTGDLISAIVSARAAMSREQSGGESK